MNLAQILEKYTLHLGLSLFRLLMILSSEMATCLKPIIFVSLAHQLETFWFGKRTQEDFQDILDVIRQLKR